MRSLLRYLLKNYSFVLFILLEFLALVMVFNYNSFQRATYLNSANRLTGSIYETFSSVKNYFALARINKEISEENAHLRSLIGHTTNGDLSADSISESFIPGDSTYQYTSARVINNSTNRPFNYITLNKGTKHGIQPDQGIISASGIVGVVTHVSDSYSVGLSVLNRRWSVSAKLKNSGYFGSLTWQENDYQTAALTEIPLHVNVAEGDTVITSGFSSVFPEGIMIGTIEEFSRPDGENYYNIRVALSTDFKMLSFVGVIENVDKNEIDELENLIRDDPMVN